MRKVFFLIFFLILTQVNGCSKETGLVFQNFEHVSGLQINADFKKFIERNSCENVWKSKGFEHCSLRNSEKQAELYITAEGNRINTIRFSIRSKDNSQVHQSLMEELDLNFSQFKIIPGQYAYLETPNLNFLVDETIVSNFHDALLPEDAARNYLFWIGTNKIKYPKTSDNEIVDDSIPSLYGFQLHQKMENTQLPGWKCFTSPIMDVTDCSKPEGEPASDSIRIGIHKNRIYSITHKVQKTVSLQLEDLFEQYGGIENFKETNQSIESLEPPNQFYREFESGEVLRITITRRNFIISLSTA